MAAICHVFLLRSSSAYSLEWLSLYQILHNDPGQIAQVVAGLSRRVIPDNLRGLLGLSSAI